MEALVGDEVLCSTDVVMCPYLSSPILSFPFQKKKSNAHHNRMVSKYPVTAEGPKSLATDEHRAEFDKRWVLLKRES